VGIGVVAGVSVKRSSRNPAARLQIPPGGPA
jgi:hypothetical protein